MMFRNRVAATPNTEAFRYPRDGAWASVTWRELGDQGGPGCRGPDRAGRRSRGTRLGWRPGHALRVVVADWHSGSRRGNHHRHPTTNAEDVAYIVANSGSRVVIAEDQTRVDKLRAKHDDVPAGEDRGHRR